MRLLRRRITWVLVASALAGACRGGVTDVAASTPEDPAAAAAAEREAAATTVPDDAEEVDLFDATQIRGDLVNQYDLQLGDCFNRIEALRAGRKVVITAKIDCEQPHQNEVFHTFEHEAPHPAIFPGDDVMTEFGLNACYQEFESFVGEIYELSQYDIGVFTPNRENFESSAARYRGITCWLYRDDSEETEGSARDSGI